MYHPVLTSGTSSRFPHYQLDVRNGTKENADNGICVGAQRVGSPKFRAFFPSVATVSILSSLSLGSSRCFLVVFFGAGALRCPRLGSRAVV